MIALANMFSPEPIRDDALLARSASRRKACGSRALTAGHLAGVRSLPSRTSGARCDGVTAGETATSFSSANTFSGIGSARGTSAMLHPGVVDRPTTLALQAGTVVTAGETATQSQANANVETQSLGQTGDARSSLVVSPRGGARLQRLSMDATGGESAATNIGGGHHDALECAAGEGLARHTQLETDLASGNAGVVNHAGHLSEQSEPSRGGCSPDLIHSSGDGPGIHQPRSTDSRCATTRIERQGRARDRVICPAVTRFSSRGGTRIRTVHALCLVRCCGFLREQSVAPDPREAVSTNSQTPARPASLPGASPAIGAQRAKRHRWPKPGNELRDEHNTTRICLDCGVRKVTRHQAGEWPWVEWYAREGERIQGDKTPECVPVGEGA